MQDRSVCVCAAAPFLDPPQGPSPRAITDEHNIQQDLNGGRVVKTIIILHQPLICYPLLVNNDLPL